MDDPACLCTFKEQQSMCYIKEQAKFNAEQIQQTRLQTKQICTFITTKFWGSDMPILHNVTDTSDILQLRDGISQR
jgi:hypothetical protein